MEQKLAWLRPSRVSGSLMGSDHIECAGEGWRGDAGVKVLDSSQDGHCESGSIVCRSGGAPCIYSFQVSSGRSSLLNLQSKFASKIIIVRWIMDPQDDHCLESLQVHYATWLPALHTCICAKDMCRLQCLQSRACLKIFQSSDCKDVCSFQTNTMKGCEWI